MGTKTDCEIENLKAENEFLKEVIRTIIAKFEDREGFIMLGPAGIISFIFQLKEKLKELNL